MKPFIYQPLPGIPYKNSPQGMNMMQNPNMGVQPNFGNKNQYNQSNDETNREMYGNGYEL